MSFFFDEKSGDELMSKINLRHIDSYAKQWEHPMRGLFKYARAMREVEGDVLSISKSFRELYCVSLMALALKESFKLDWWIAIPPKDPPDGLVMTLVEEEKGIKGMMREVEVVEHRIEGEKLLEVITAKMTEKSYVSDTVLVCLGLTPGLYNLEVLSKQLQEIKSSLRHVFMVFGGIATTPATLQPETLPITFTMVQLLPRFEVATFNLQPYIEDFKEKYDVGRELRIIRDGSVFYGTANPKHLNKES